MHQLVLLSELSDVGLGFLVFCFILSQFFLQMLATKHNVLHLSVVAPQVSKR